jgi:hypothetical protein
LGGSIVLGGLPGGQGAPSLSETHNKLILHPSFRQTLAALKEIRIALPRDPVTEDTSLRNYDLPRDRTRLAPLEAEHKFALDGKRGEEVAEKGVIVSAYDESINKFTALEGTAYFTSHSLVVLASERYLPINLLTFYFLTRSRDIQSRSEFIQYSEDFTMDSEKTHILDKITFLLENAPPNSILLIDGPLIAGDVYTRIIRQMRAFHERGMLPVWFVKNSNSNLVVDNTPELAGRFNSDLHWANELLKPGERTRLFRYQDLHNPRNAKVFCYVRSLKTGPMRVEVHLDTYEQHANEMRGLLDLIHYFILVQGSEQNPQVRPIAIAEKFARETLKLIDFDVVMRSSGVSPSMNQERFAW